MLVSQSLATSQTYSFRSWTECFWNDRKKLSHFGRNVWKYRLMNTATASLNATETNDRNVSTKKNSHKRNVHTWIVLLHSLCPASPPPVCDVPAVSCCRLNFLQTRTRFLLLSSSVRTHIRLYTNLFIAVSGRYYLFSNVEQPPHWHSYTCDPVQGNLQFSMKAMYI